jgi:hypothetical protein
LTDDGETNNFGDWRVKVEKKFQANNLPTFLTDSPPTIPKPCKSYQVTGPEAQRNPTTITVEGNKATVKKASEDATPWFQKNDTVISILMESLPSLPINLIQNEPLTKNIWNTLIYHCQNPSSFMLTHYFSS